MNNALYMSEDVLKEDNPKDNSEMLRQRAEELTDIVEAIQNIGGSSYWKVFKKYVFDVELSKSKRSLELERDTTEMFRLQGDIRALKKLNLEALLTKYRNELQVIKQKINE